MTSRIRNIYSIIKVETTILHWLIKITFHVTQERSKSYFSVRLYVILSYCNAQAITCKRHVLAIRFLFDAFTCTFQIHKVYADEKDFVYVFVTSFR